MAPPEMVITIKCPKNSTGKFCYNYKLQNNNIQYCYYTNFCLAGKQ